MREEAAELLGSMGDAAAQQADAVAHLLSDSQAFVRTAAAKALVQMGWQGAVHAKAIAGLIADSEWYCSLLAKALRQGGEPGTVYAVAVLHRLADERPHVCQRAVQCLVSAREVSSGSVGRHDLRREIRVRSEWGALLHAASSCKPRVEQIGDHEVWMIEDLLSDAECAALVAGAECRGFGQTAYSKSYRGNLHLQVDDQSLASAMWARLESLVPARVFFEDHPGDETEPCEVQWDACGLNERWRLSKYYPGDRFGGHMDATFVRHPHLEMSAFTVNIYLNGGFEGGTTRMYFKDHSNPDFIVAPKAGSCLLFRQPPGQSYYHDGEELASGLKYLLRSDVMYRRKR